MTKLCRYIKSIRIPLVLKIGGLMYIVLAVYFTCSYLYIKSHDRISRPYSVHVSPIGDALQQSKGNNSTTDSEQTTREFVFTKKYRKWSNAGFISRTFHLPLVLTRDTTYGRTLAAVLMGTAFVISPYYLPLSFIFEESSTPIS